MRGDSRDLGSSLTGPSRSPGPLLASIGIAVRLRDFNFFFNVRILSLTDRSFCSRKTRMAPGAPGVTAKFRHLGPWKHSQGPTFCSNCAPPDLRPCARERREQ